MVRSGARYSVPLRLRRCNQHRAANRQRLLVRLDKSLRLISGASQYSNTRSFAGAMTMTNHFSNFAHLKPGSTFLRLAMAPVLMLVCLAVGPSATAQVNSDLLQSLHWRSIGPFRGGRTRAVAGVPSQPNLFYVAQVNGGVFKTTDYGRTWIPIF